MWLPGERECSGPGHHLLACPLDRMHWHRREMNPRREFIWVTIATEGGYKDGFGSLQRMHTSWYDNCNTYFSDFKCFRESLIFNFSSGIRTFLRPLVVNVA